MNNGSGVSLILPITTGGEFNPHHCCHMPGLIILKTFTCSVVISKLIIIYKVSRSHTGCS